MPGAHIETLALMSQPRFDGTSHRQCPQCGAFLVRIPRRLRDRITSIVTPVHRYHCIGFTCHWEGNLTLASAPAPDRDNPH
jgi:hypothetical protein